MDLLWSEHILNYGRDGLGRPEPSPATPVCLSCVLWSDSELGREFERTYGVRERCPGLAQVPE